MPRDDVYKISLSYCIKMLQHVDFFNLKVYGFQETEFNIVYFMQTFTMSLMTIAGLQKVFCNLQLRENGRMGYTEKINTKPPFLCNLSLNLTWMMSNSAEPLQSLSYASQIQIRTSAILTLKTCAWKHFRNYYKSLQCENTRFGKPVQSIDINTLQKSRE